MTSSNQTRRAPEFPREKLPWIVAGGMFIIYLATLYHRPSPTSMLTIASLSGWNWRPTIFSPITFLLTYPLRWFPVNSIPIAANLFSAVCSSLCIFQLVRTVALLPHDRTHHQRDREHSEHSLLSIKQAWMPPIFAALLLGFQLTFWENAVQATGESLDLLMFAYIVRCLLEFRISQKDSWLYRMAFVGGLAIANNWGIVAFAPLFLIGAIWSRGPGFFNRRFFLPAMVLFLAGLVFILILPAMLAINGKGQLGFGAGVHYVFTGYKSILFGFPRNIVFLLSLTSVVPVLVICFRWASFFGDTSPLGVLMADSMFHIMHAVFLLAGFWVLLDCPLSARQLGYGYPFLTLYYLVALCAGYCAGYFILVFGTERHMKAWQKISSSMVVARRCVAVSVWALLCAVVGLLLYKNLPSVSERKTEPLRQFDALVEKTLPPGPAVILSDDTFRLFSLEGILNKTGKRDSYMLVETGLLGQVGDYFTWLKERYPKFFSTANVTNTLSQVPNEFVLLQIMQALSKHNGIYYLQPSFGYYFEMFYPRPANLFYRLAEYPVGTFTAPAMSPDEISRNEGFWRQVEADQFGKLKTGLGVGANARAGLLDSFFNLIHAAVEPNKAAAIAGTYYALDLNYWGVEQQKSGKLKEAAHWFETARQLNPKNTASKINLDFNEMLQQHKQITLKADKAIEDEFGEHRNWPQILSADGPIDEPAFHQQLGMVFANGRLFRQSIQQLERLHELMPQNVDALVLISQVYLFAGAYSNSVEKADKVLALAPNQPNAMFIKASALIQLKDYAAAVPLLTRVLSAGPNNYAVLQNRAIANLQLGNLADAEKDYVALDKLAPNSYKTYYGLGEIAYRRKDTNSAVKYFRMYLTNAPPSTDEFNMISNRLHELTVGGH